MSKQLNIQFLMNARIAGMIENCTKSTVQFAILDQTIGSKIVCNTVLGLVNYNIFKGH